MEGLLVAWDDAVADAAFAMNMDLDEPRELRRAAVEKVAADLGPFRPDATRPEVSELPAHLTWWVRGKRGWVRLALLVTPEPSPRVQRFAVTAVPDPSAVLEAIADRILAAAGSPSPAWPADVVAGPDLDPVPIERSMRAAAARFGTMRRGLPTAGDGTTTATFQVTATTGAPSSRSRSTPESGAVTTLVLSAAEREAAAEAW